MLIHLSPPDVKQRVTIDTDRVEAFLRNQGLNDEHIARVRICVTDCKEVIPDEEPYRDIIVCARKSGFNINRINHHFVSVLAFYIQECLEIPGNTLQLQQDAEAFAKEHASERFIKERTQC